MANTAEHESGGTADAQQQIGGTVVIYMTGSWVGPTIKANWSDLQGVPADIADGDDDTLAESRANPDNSKLEWPSLGMRR